MLLSKPSKSVGSPVVLMLCAAAAAVAFGLSRSACWGTTLTATAKVQPSSVVTHQNASCVSTAIISGCDSAIELPEGPNGGVCPNKGTLYSPICTGVACIKCSAANQNIQGYCEPAYNYTCKQNGTAQCGMQEVGTCQVVRDSDGDPYCGCLVDGPPSSTACVVQTCIP